MKSNINILHAKFYLPLMIALILFTPKIYADAIDDIPPGHWYEIPNSVLENTPDVVPNPIPAGSTGIKSVTNSWNGGVFDTKRNRLVIWGGGHTNYSGNEIYAFDLDTLQWERLSDPSSLSGWTDGDVVYSDGRPVSRHTYNYLEYIPPPYDKFFVGGGAALYLDSWNDVNTYYFDFNTNEWETLTEPTPNFGIGAIAVTDPVTKQVWFHGAGQGSYLSMFDPKSEKWTLRGTKNGGWVAYRWSAAIDPIRRKLVAIGNSGKVYVWDLTKSGDIAYYRLETTGDTEILLEDSPGFAFDPVSQQLVAWSGGANIYTLNLDTATWSRISPAATNTTIPTDATATGIFGRFRYVPDKNVFIAVNATYESVYVYRLTSPLSSPSVPLSPDKPTVHVK